MPNLEYDGPIQVYDKKADGTKLIIGKGDRAGEPYYKISFKVGGEYVNLMDFNGVTGGQPGQFHVDYYQKYQPNGEPELYNGKPQYQLETITPLGGAQGVHSQAPASQQGTGSQTATDVAIRKAVAAKCASEMHPAAVSEWLMWAEAIDNWLSGSNELDQMLDAAKSKLMDDVDDPDDDIPFA